MICRKEDLQREAARCFEAARKSKNSTSRDELTRLAIKFLTLADHQPSYDFEAILDSFNTAQMGHPGGSVARQRQPQPKQEDER